MGYGFYVALLAMTVSAVAAIAARGPRASVLWAGMSGAAVCCAMALAGAPGPAMLVLASTAVGGGFLLRITEGLGGGTSSRFGAAYVATGLALAAAVALSCWALSDLPSPGQTPAGTVPEIDGQLAFGQTGAANLLASVLFDFRAFDGMCAVSLVVAACSGAMWLTGRAGARRELRPPATRAAAVISGIVITAAIVAAAHMITHGHLRAGGGFAGGVALAAALIAAARRFGDDAAQRLVCLRSARSVTVLAAGAFVLLGLAGTGSGYVFFSRVIPPGPAFAVPGAGTIFWASLASGVAIGLGIYGAYLALGADAEEGAT